MYEITRNVLAEVKKAIVGKDDVISKVWIALLAEGHVLLEDVPGVGKTRRIQHHRQARRRRFCQPVHSGSLGRRAACHYLRAAGSPLL